MATWSVNGEYTHPLSDRQTLVDWPPIQSRDDDTLGSVQRHHEAGVVMSRWQPLVTSAGRAMVLDCSVSSRERSAFLSFDSVAGPWCHQFRPAAGVSQQSVVTRQQPPSLD